MIDSSNWPDHIKERYGVGRKPTFTIALATVTAILVTAGLGMANYRQDHPAINWQLKAFKIVDESKVSVEWQIVREEKKDTYCVIRAQDAKRRDVGYVTVLVEGGDKNATMNYDLNTESLAVLAEILGCAYQPKMRVPPADFPPGVKIPTQNPPGFAPTSN